MVVSSKWLNDTIFTESKIYLACVTGQKVNIKLLIAIITFESLLIKIIHRLL